MTGPIRVPSPPMMTQMMIWPLTGRLNMVGLTNPELANSSRQTRPAAADHEDRELVDTRIVAQQLGARLVLADRHHHAAELVASSSLAAK